MFIPDEKVEEVRAATDIVDVVGEYVRLKKRGSKFVGLCPFHTEKTPSFNVDPKENLFYCFGCQKGGDTFSFVREKENLSFPETVRLLAEKAGIALPEGEDQADPSNETEQVYYALRFAGRFFYHQLTQTEEGRRGLDYLQGRGFTSETIKRFGLGYAPNRWDALLNAAEGKRLAPEALAKAGLVVARQKGGGYYDRYRGRVIFPIFSNVGKVLGFGGRILDKDADQPKYINSPETTVYHKSRVLYGLHQGKNAIRRSEEVLLVEGYTDAIALHQAGLENVVAACGTSITPEHLKTLGRYAKRIVFLGDGDAAGDKSAVRGIEIALRERALTPYVVELPEGEDPDSFVKGQGPEAFAEYLRTYRWSFVQFMLIRARQDGRLADPQSETEALHEVLRLIALLDDPIARDAYVYEMSQRLDQPDILLRSELNRVLMEEARKAQRERRRPSRSNGQALDVPAFGPASDGRPSEAEARTSDGRPAKAEAQASDGRTSGGDGEGEADVQGAPPRPARTSARPEEEALVRLMLEGGTPMVEFVLGSMALEEFTEGAPRQAAAALLSLYEGGDVQSEPVLNGRFGPDVQAFAAAAMIDQHEPSRNWALRKNIPVPPQNEDPYEAAASAMMLLKLDRVDEAIERLKRQQFAAVADEALRQIQAEIIQLQTLRKQVQARAFLDWSPS